MDTIIVCHKLAKNGVTALVIIHWNALYVFHKRGYTAYGNPGNQYDV